MKRVIRRGSHRIEILKWYECGPDNTCMEFDSPVSAFTFLCGFTPNHFNMLTLRNVLADGLYCADIFRATDHEICQQVACQIAHAYIKLVPTAEKIARASFLGVTTSRSTTEDTDATQTAVPEAPQTYTPTQTPEETEPEPDLVPAGAAATQAATMTQAAESGAPFCET